MKVQQERGRARNWRRFTARAAVLGLISMGAVFALAASAGADSADPGGFNSLGNAPTGTAVLNGDGSITVTVTGTWYWGGKNCSDFSTDAKQPGWAVSWGDNQSNDLGTTPDIYVGTATDNAVHVDATFNSNDSCQDVNSNKDSQGTFAETLSHTYAAGTTEIAPCVVTYDVVSGTDTGNHSLIAGMSPPGDDNPKHNADNSVEQNASKDGVPAEGSCAPVVFSPDVSILKTGPATAVVGTPITYALTATNTGAVPADNVTITDVIPAGATFVSADSPCTYDSGTATVTCNVGTLALAGTATVHITVTPTVSGASLANTATVTPEDSTPNDNTSTWTIENVAVSPAVVVTTPTFTG